MGRDWTQEQCVNMIRRRKGATGNCVVVGLEPRELKSP